ncbi:hypothetical protein F7725_002567 [Dissostichus mawsoni]|uniref:Mediator of RNA polymerase II transcription subunit 4 n=1 Tax=Dissostichus mawsoni TaxID=36200 RepID=A0A7J5Y5W1_DISMA|nr:hypothetical protein F7725_002567 [Dissostichus mawsoni]
MAAVEKSTKDRLLSVLEDLEVLELLVQRDQELQDLMEVAQQQGKVQEEMQLLEKESNFKFIESDPRRPYPTDLEMRSGMLGHMANLPTNGVNGHLPGDALAAGRLPECVQQAKDSLRSLADSPEQG